MTGGGEQGTHAASHIGPADNDDAARFHPEGADAVCCLATSKPAQ
jgi:hypothetical protein